MPITYRYDPDKRALYGAVSGVLLVEDVAATLRDIVTSDLHPPTVRTIWDLTGMDFKGFGRNTMDQLVDIRAAVPERRLTRRAIVAADNLGFGMLRMYVVISEPLGDEMKVFRTFPEAEAWLLQD